MMAELKVDTLRFAEQLEEAGLDRKVAEDSSKAVAHVFSRAGRDLVNQQDLEIFKAEIGAWLAEVRKETARSGDAATLEVSRLRLELAEERGRFRAELSEKRGDLRTYLSKQNLVVDVLRFGTLIGVIVALTKIFT